MDTSPLRPLLLAVAALTSLMAAYLLGRQSPAPHALTSPPAQARSGDAAGAPAPRTVSVHGTAEVTTTPDELIIGVRIDSFDRKLQAAKADNDQRARVVMQLLAKHGVEAKNAQTDDFSIQPRHEVIREGAHDTQRLVGYDVRKHITLTVCEIEKAESLLAELFDGGANALDQVTFRPSKAAEKRAEARKLAAQAARAKAEAIAGELGQRLGRPIKVDEGGEPGYAFGRFTNSNYVAHNESAPSGSDTLAAGKARVQASVSVVFELVD